MIKILNGNADLLEMTIYPTAVGLLTNILSTDVLEDSTLELAPLLLKEGETVPRQTKNEYGLSMKLQE